MLTYCIHCKKRTQSDLSGMSQKRLKNGAYLVSSVCQVCKKKKSNIVAKKI